MDKNALSANVIKSVATFLHESVAQQNSSKLLWAWLLNSKKGRVCGRKIDHNLQKSDDNDGTGKKLCDWEAYRKGAFTREDAKFPTELSSMSDIPYGQSIVGTRRPSDVRKLFMRTSLGLKFRSRLEITRTTIALAISWTRVISSLARIFNPSKFILYSIRTSDGLLPTIGCIALLEFRDRETSVWCCP